MVLDLAKVVIGGVKREESKSSQNKSKADERSQKQTG
jgi:hypothetical protein